jgi:CrcB protein
MPVMLDDQARSVNEWLQAGLVFLGAGAGGLARYGLSALIQSQAGAGFPWATLCVNVTGCFAGGLLGTLLAANAGMRTEFKAAVIVGVLGGYTTFSTFGRESAALFGDGQWGRGLAYVQASNVLGIACVGLGVLAAKRLSGA